ncbi:GntR family transcriptional regulator [Kineosporia sp. J2-2]|uniref:GntR family transcriptional regulator n=1 Tax=Kineosporia corallincola TaxID=2835133 RepID=A0ABS5TP81_9ACTN|nr:GntR family transcriptional regulator [Kineosporia corallincola]MBT0772908.1 GntR family transcriptional regulator [Kineosporia corallincola]
MTVSAGDLSKSQTAYLWLRERIATGAFGPGYRLVLSSLAAELSMSVVPVREAVRALTAEGLVSFERNVGARVALLDDAQYRFALQTISVVEGAATALAAPLLTPADLARARELNDMVRQGLPDLDPRVFRTVNQELHRTLYAPCPNPRLLEVVASEWARLGHLRDSASGIVPGRASATVAEHDDLIDLIENGATATRIEAAVRRHRTGSLPADLAVRHPEAGPCDPPLPAGA